MKSLQGIGSSVLGLPNAKLGIAARKSTTEKILVLKNILE